MSKASRTLPEGYEIVEENGRSVARKVAAQTPAAPSGQKAQIRIIPANAPNKLEEEWMQRERRLRPGRTFLYEPFNFRLEGNVRYCPDWVVISPEGQIEMIAEIKPDYLGTKDRDSLVRFKAARERFPFWNFQFHQKTKTGWAVA